jgi:FMN-dependent NADH-azoreductase
MKELESGDRYLQIAMNFLGISMMDTVFAEGLDHFPNQINEIVSAAKEKAAYAAREMAKCTVEA